MGVPWQKSISGFVNLPEDGRRKRVVEKFASIARGGGGGEQEEEKEEEERKGRRMLPAATSGEVEGIKRGYPPRCKTLFLIRHQLAHASSRGIFHRVIPLRGRKPHSTVQKYRRDVAGWMLPK